MEVQMVRTIKVVLVAAAVVIGFAGLSLGVVPPTQAFPFAPVDPE
jgi:hypothetical protein